MIRPTSSALRQKEKILRRASGSPWAPAYPDNPSPCLKLKARHRRSRRLPSTLPAGEKRGWALKSPVCLEMGRGPQHNTPSGQPGLPQPQVGTELRLPAFVPAVPSAWNALPQEDRTPSFKSQLQSVLRGGLPQLSPWCSFVYLLPPQPPWSQH